MSIANLQ